MEVAQAPGEIEACCACLQNIGEIDIVLTTDSDAFPPLKRTPPPPKAPKNTPPTDDEINVNLFQ